MARANRREHRPPRRERGIAMVAIVSLLALISAYMIANGLSRTSAELLGERERRSMEALRQAKAALIAYAASEQWQQFRSCDTLPIPCPIQPGALPCPDRNDDGGSDGLCSNALTRVGKLPWKTLGIDDLRDASGERLWYAVSSNFRKYPYPASGYTIINSDTQGQLTVTGTAPANNVIAIVFAPGQPIGAQDRSTAPNDPAAYLEGFTAGATDYTFTTTALASDTHNDRLLVITHADLFSVVEPVVVGLIERDVKPQIFAATGGTSYFERWDAFPFPSTFANPDPGTNGTGTTRAQSAYVGSISETSGLLPITASAGYPWTAGSGSVAKVGGFGTISGVSCTALSGWKCTFTVSRESDTSDLISDLLVRVRGRIGANAGISLPSLPNASAVTATIVPATFGNTLSLPSISGSLTSGGIGRVSFLGTLPINCSPCGAATYVVDITIPDVTVSNLTSTDKAQNPAYWFIANEWYRQTYYAVSPGYLPSGSGNCSPLPGTPSCLTVNNLPPNYSPGTNKRAILVLAGRSFNGSARPSSSLANYLEGQNTTPGDFIFEHRAGVSTTINDRVVVVSP